MRASIVVGVLFVACASTQVEPVPTLATAEPVPSAAPVPEATSEPAPTASLPPVEPVDASRVRRPKVSSSPGQIECRDVVCELATELCCQSHYAGTCVPKDKPEGCGDVELLWKYCDESADCGKGNACCYAPRPDQTVYATNVCRKARCEPDEPEKCLAGGKCSGGRACKVEGDSYDGYCR